MKALLILILLGGLGGCMERTGEPQFLADGTSYFKPITTASENIAITFYKKKSEDGQYSGVDTLYTLRSKGILRADIELQIHEGGNPNDQLLHLMWVDPEGNALYQKQFIENFEGGKISLYSSISIVPEERLPGRYSLKVYHARELMAQRYFTLLTSDSIQNLMADRLKTQITLFTKLDKETNERSGIDTSFVLKRKGRVRLFVDFENVFIPADQELELKINWVGPDGEVFYDKEIELSPGDNPESVYSSISATPKNREPGTYRIDVLAFDKLVNTKTYSLIK